MTRLDRDQILAYRYTVNGLHNRLPAGRLAAAARAGLQDSTPRSGVLALHARAAGVTSEDWSDQSLVQVWGPRGAIYLVPNEDLAVFTLGLLPRSEARRRVIGSQARMVIRMLDGRPRSAGAILKAIPAIGGIRELLWTATSGWFLPRWDGSTTAVYPAEPAEADEEASRLELARRFLHYLGPSTTKGLQWWTGSSSDDAVATMAALGPELATIDAGGEEVLMLAEDVEHAVEPTRPNGIHLLPPEDVYINRLCGPRLLPDGDLYRILYPRAPLPGAVVVDGQVAAVWRRRDRKLTVFPLRGVKVTKLIRPVEQAAQDLPLPGDPADTVVTWQGG